MSAQPDYDAMLPEPQTLRVWLSEQQWMSLISRIEQGRASTTTDNDPSQRRSEPRISATFHCILRVTKSDGASATYTVRSCNLSNGGMGFVHDRELPVGAACTVALEQSGYGGRVVGATVAWSRPVEGVEGVHEVGLQFTQPIDAEAILPPSAA